MPRSHPSPASIWWPSPAPTRSRPSTSARSSWTHACAAPHRGGRPCNRARVAAIGLDADVVPPIFTAESLAQTIVQTLLPEAPGARILLVLAEQAPATLASALAAAGARVTVAAAYGNRIPRASLAALAALFADPRRYPTPSPLPAPPPPGNLIALLDAAVSRCPPRSYAPPSGRSPPARSPTSACRPPGGG